MSLNIRSLNNPFRKVAAAAAALLLLGACASKEEPQTSTSEGGVSTQPAAENNPLQEWTDEVPDRVFFALDSSSLDEADRQALNRQANFLQEHSQITVTVEGHCDERGTREYNLALGARRANSIKNYLVSQGVDPSRITTISYGKERPADPRSTEAAWRVNRRGVTVPRNNPGS